MIQDLETKSGEKAEMAKLTLYIQNRNVTEFRQEQLFYTLHVTQRCRVRPLKYDFQEKISKKPIKIMCEMF